MARVLQEIDFDVPGGIDNYELIESVSESWSFRNWSTSHARLTSAAGCCITSGSLEFRFYLRPHEECLTFNNEIYTNDWYSLWIELVSVQKDVILLNIATVVDAYSENLVDFQKKESQHLFRKTEARANAVIEKNAEEKFILMHSWRTQNGVGPGTTFKMQLHNDEGLKYKYVADEIKILLSTTFMRALRLPAIPLDITE